MMKSLFVALAACFTVAAQAGVVVIGHPGAAPLSKDQVSDIFLGKNTSATPLDLPESSPLRAQFYTKATGKDVSQVKATWSRITFSGKGQPPRELPDAIAVKKEVAANANAVGYIDSSAVDGSVKVLLTLD